MCDSDFGLASAQWLSATATNNKDTQEALATKTESVQKWQMISPLIQLMQGERQLQVLIQGRNSFDVSVEAVHDNFAATCKSLGCTVVLFIHTRALFWGELYNVNTAMCYKTYQCLQNICFGLDMQRIILEQQGGLLGV